MDAQSEQLIARARYAFERRDYSAALADAQAVLSGHPDFADVRHLAGVCLSLLGQPTAALAEFERAIRLNPDYVEAHLNRAITLNELGRHEEARVAFEEAWRSEHHGDGPFPAAVAARLANAHAHLGDLYAEAGAGEDAVAEYRAALRTRPGFVDIRNKLAHALLELDRLDEAEAELYEALAINPRFVDARLNLALVFFRRGQRDAALVECRVALEQEPDSAQAQAYLAMMGQSRPSAVTSEGA